MKGVYMGEQNKNDNSSSSENSKRPYPRLDYTITDPQERNKKVHEIVNNTAPQLLTPYYLEQLTKYLTETTQTKRQKKVLTDNRMVTINKRETSYQGLVVKLENGQDGIYNFMTGGDKNILLVPKIYITEDDIATIPGLKQLREEIKKIENKLKTAKGRQKSLLTKQLIEMRQDQYIFKSAFKPPVTSMKLTKSVNQISLDEHVTIGQDGEPISDCLVSLFDPHHICCILCNYSSLKEESYGHFNSDWWHLMQDFDSLLIRALKEDYPILYDVMIYKMQGMQNKDISKKLNEDYGVTYSAQYLSSLWRKKIPKIIADKAKEEWVIWHYTFEEKGKWKRCSRCHQIKLAHPYFFTRNRTAKDGWYSMCKKCRNKKSEKFKVKKG